MTSSWMSDRHSAVGVPESTRTRRHVRLAQSVRCVYVYDIPNVMYIVRVCARTPVSVRTFAPKSKDTTCMIHRATVRGYPSRFGKVEVRLDDRRVYAFRFGRRCASWSSIRASMSACMVELARRNHHKYDIERVSRVPSTRSRDPAGSTRRANAIDARPVTSTRRSSGSGAWRPHAHRTSKDFANRTCDILHRTRRFTVRDERAPSDARVGRVARVDDFNSNS